MDPLPVTTGKYCVDCVFFNGRPALPDEWTCMKDFDADEETVDLITGILGAHTFPSPTCVFMRRDFTTDGFEACGPEGRYYSAKAKP